MKRQTFQIILGIIFLVLLIFVIKNPNKEMYSLQSCGNGICESKYGENYKNCNLDCAFCGNNICEYNKYPPEHFDSCPQDCHEKNGICESEYGENCGNSEDCICGYGQYCNINKCEDIPKEEPPVEKPSIWQQEIFKIGNVSVTFLMITILLVFLFGISFLIGK